MSDVLFCNLFLCDTLRVDKVRHNTVSFKYSYEGETIVRVSFYREKSYNS